MPLFFPSFFFAESWCQDPIDNEKLFHPSLVNTFYSLNSYKLFWMGQESVNTTLRRQLVNSIDSAYRFGLADRQYHKEELLLQLISKTGDSLMLMKADRIYTDAAIALCKDVYQGYRMRPWVGYDQLSAQYESKDNEHLLNLLLRVSTAMDFELLVASLEPKHREYILLKSELSNQLEKGHKDTVAMLQLSMGCYRWIHHFDFKKYIVVNLPEARLRYYENDSLLLNMKTVVGKTSTPTPRFATICDQVVLYPYWYVPRSITFNEYLPKIKRNPSWIDANNMQIIDGSGKVMNHLKMNWNSYHTGYFPYIIRQSTGCDNALGVIKFNIITPYGVYLHDTNNKTVFLSGQRYYSHGCIRLEEPFVLGDKLLPGKLDSAYLQSCFKQKMPEFIKLEQPVPVFSVYMPAVGDTEGKISYYKDVYKLIRGYYNN